MCGARYYNLRDQLTSDKRLNTGVILENACALDNVTLVRRALEVNDKEVKDCVDAILHQPTDYMFNVEVMKLLFEFSGSDATQHLFVAMRANNRDMVNMLLNYGKLNTRDIVWSGFVNHGDYKWVLDHPIININDDEFIQLLCHAERCDRLIALLNDSRLTDIGLNNIFYRACSYGLLEICKLIFHRITDHKKGLRYAIMGDHPDLVDYLLSSKKMDLTFENNWPMVYSNHHNMYVMQRVLKRHIGTPVPSY